MSVIGIDFGTEFSSVAARLQDGHIHTLADDQGKIRISSCISFLEDEIRIGNLAELKRETNVKNTLYDFKMLLGQDLKTAMQLKKTFEWPFVLVKDDNGKAQFQVQYLNTTHHFYPEEIVAILFHHLIQIAEKRMQPIRVSGAVITVPSTFNHLQRKSIMDAARIANIEVECLLNDTTAAALCYWSFSAIGKKNVSQCAMVINIGSGTLTVALCRIEGLTVSVQAIDGTDLGGKDINMTIFGSMKKLRMNQNSTLSSYSNLHNMIERVKKDFCASEKRRSKLVIQSKNGNGEEYVDIQRDVFQKACCPIRDSLESAINGVMDYAAKTPDEIDKVLVVGGSTRLSLVHDILDKLKLKPKLEMAGVKTNEAAALGACVRACVLPSKPEHLLRINEVLSYSILDKDNNLLYKKNCPLKDNQERNWEFNPHKNGQIFKLFDQYRRLMIFAKCKNFVKFPLILKIDENGMLSIFGKELTDVIDGLPEDKISGLVAQHCQLHEGHAEKELAEEARYHFEKDVFNTMKMAKKLLKDCEAFEDWIENNSDSTLTNVRVKREELKSLLHPFSRNDNVEQQKPTKHSENGFCCKASQHLEQLQCENTHWKTQIAKREDVIKTLELEKKRLECMRDKPTTSSKKGFSRDSSQNLEVLLQENKCLKEKESNQSIDNKAMEHEIKKLQSILELGGKSFADEQAKLKEQISKRNKDIEALRKELSCKAKLTTQEEYEKLKRINEEYRSNEQSLNCQMKAKRNEIKNLKHVETTFRQQLSEKDKKIKDLQKQLECKANVKTSEEYEKLKCDMQIVVQQNKEAEEEIDNLKRQILRINEEYRGNEISFGRRIQVQRTEIRKLKEIEDERNATLKQVQELWLYEKKVIENERDAISKQFQEAIIQLSENEKKINKLINEVKELGVNKDNLLIEIMELHEERENLQAKLEHYGESEDRLAIQRDDTGSRRIHVRRNQGTQKCEVINEVKNSRSSGVRSKSSSQKKMASDTDRHPKPGNAKRCSSNELEDSKSRPSSSQSDTKKRGKGLWKRMPWK